jgi:hypothetical protein
MQWSLKALKENIYTLYGDEQLKLVSPSLDSIFENQDFVRYHYSELNRLVKEHMEGIDGAHDYVDLILTNEIDILNKQYDYGISYKANIMALVRNLHSINDLLAHTIYFSLGLNLIKKTQIKPRCLNLYQVKEKLKHIKNATGLISDLEKMMSHEDNQYLNSLVNHSKHRANIAPKLSYELNNSGADIYKFSFQEFEYDDITYEKKLADPFLNSMYDHQSQLIIEIGNKINLLVAEAC